MVHEELIRAYSTKLLGDRQENPTPRYIAVDLSNASLSLLGSWLYSGNLETSCIDETVPQTLFDLYIFTHVHDFPSIRNAIIYRLWHFYHGGMGFAIDALPSTETIDHIFDSLPSDSELCVLLIELIANHWAPDHDTEPAYQPFKPKNVAFLQALVERQASLRYQAWDQPDEACDCRFLYHDKDRRWESAESLQHVAGERRCQRRVKAWLNWNRGPREWLSSQADPEAEAESDDDGDEEQVYEAWGSEVQEDEGRRDEVQTEEAQKDEVLTGEVTSRETQTDE